VPGQAPRSGRLRVGADRNWPVAALGRRRWPDPHAHLASAQREHQLFDTIDVDIDGEPAQLGPSGYRPLRVRDTRF
jgi:hypothetical protein